MNIKIKTIIFILILPLISQAQNLILDGTSIPLDGASSASIDATTGNVIVTSQAGDLTCSSSSTPPVLSSFTASPTAVVSGGSSTLSWTLSGQATSCTKSGDWSGTLTGSDVADGTNTELVTNITTNSTYSLQCSNSTGSSAIGTAGVTITTTANCVPQPPILNGNEDTTIIGNNSANAGLYNGTFQGFQNNGGATPDWPGTYGDSMSLSLTRNQYIAASFTTNNSNEQGRFQLSTPSNTQGPAASTTIVISECPGDFTTHLSQTRCRRIVGPSGSLRWATDPSANGASYCKLDKNTTYYLNIVHSITPTNSTPENNFSTTSCSGPTHCGVLAVMVSE